MSLDDHSSAPVQERRQKLDPDSLPDHHRSYYLRYEAALDAVLDGDTASNAAKVHKVRKATLLDIIAEFERMHPDGTLVGYRACIPHRRRERDLYADNAGAGEVPATQANTRPPPTTLDGVLARVPAAAKLLAGFRGRLPERNKPSKPFENLLKRFFSHVKAAGLGTLPMWDSENRGRRAIVRRIAAARRLIPAPASTETRPTSERATRQDQVVDLRPLDRLEADQHKIDVDWHVLVPATGGKWTTRIISMLIITLFLDASSRAVLGWHITIGRRYKRFDLLRSAEKCLRLWRPRTLVIPGHGYRQDAWMPSAVSAPGGLYRPASLAMDNAMAHLATNTVTNLARHFKGVINHGYPAVPEGRPHIEALNRKLEEKLFRLMPGGFKPASGAEQSGTPTSIKKPEDYPVQLTALEDVIDVAVANYNVTPQDALDHRSPRYVYESHYQDAIPARSTLTAEDAKKLVLIRETVTLRGKKDVRQPYVKWMHGIYRSERLYGLYTELGNSFAATVDANDPRKMSLWRDGKLLAVLYVLAPWADSPHDIETRERAHNARKRGLVKIEPNGDLVKAYEDYVRACASRYTWAADEYLRLDLQEKPRLPALAPRGTSPIFDIGPRKK